MSKTGHCKVPGFVNFPVPVLSTGKYAPNFLEPVPEQCLSKTMIVLIEAPNTYINYQR